MPSLCEKETTERIQNNRHRKAGIHADKKIQMRELVPKQQKRDNRVDKHKTEVQLWTMQLTRIQLSFRILESR
jgi:hypothetical protein